MYLETNVLAVVYKNMLYEITVPCITSVNEDTVINSLVSFIKYVFQNIIKTVPIVIKSHEGQKN